MKSSRKPKEPIKPVNAWWCETCGSKEMTHSEMMEHLRSAHHLETKGLKCKRTMTLHLDCADCYSSQYEVTIPVEPDQEIKLTNSTTNPREKNDPMSHYA